MFYKIAYNGSLYFFIYLNVTKNHINGIQRFDVSLTCIIRDWFRFPWQLATVSLVSGNGHWLPHRGLPASATYSTLQAVSR